ncbi:serine protease inhibitor Kazal-type 13 [Trichechus manatus latirostris]|uniref:Serine protease inhibitor Kazal-type 13 n=1 Tax=Trichechus manatus latirostris TaxID=127582 RepID=A0A2Y9RSR3_TRIMA|nr:serine protease inhibitor Kazal-type 13 [Trichechus manatus latirostris]
MASSPHVTIFVLVSSTLAQIVVSDFSKAYDVSQWPKPQCEMYYPEYNYPAHCPDVTSYICATTGYTYKNECFLCVDQASNNNIQFEKHGRCED